MANSDPNDVFKVIRFLLEATGNWPKVNSTLFYKFRALIGFMCIAAFVGLGVTKICIDFKGIESITHPVFINLEVFSYLPKILMFYYKRPDFFRILKNVNKPILRTYDDDLDFYMKKKIEIFNKLEIIMQGLCWSALVSSCLIPFFGSNFNKDLGIPFPFDLKEKPIGVYIFVWIYQVVTLNTAATNNISLDILACSFMGITSAHLEILREELTRIANMLIRSDLKENQYLEMYGNYENEILSKIKKCINYHDAIEQLVESVDSTFNLIFLIQFLDSIFVICLTLFTFILFPIASVQVVASFLFLVCMFIQLAIYCGFGNDVIVQSSKIGEACYMSEWLNCSDAVRKSLFIIMERSKRPYEFTAGKFIILSLSSFLTIVKSSFSYLTVLNKMYTKSTTDAL